MSEEVQPTAWLIEGPDGVRMLQFSSDVAECDEQLVTKTPLYVCEPKQKGRKRR